MWTSTAASGFGDRVIMLAALALFGALAAGADTTATDSETKFFFFLPYIGASLLGGWLGDKLPRKYIMMVCDESRGLLMLGTGLWVATMTGVSAQLVDHRWPLWVILGTIGFFAALFNPVRNAIVPELVPKKQLQPANAVILVINVIASMIGMVIVPKMMTTEDVHTVKTCLYIGAAFYLVSGFFYLFLKPLSGHELTPKHHKEAAQQAKPKKQLGLFSYLFSHKKVMAVICVDIMVWTVAAVLTTGIFGICKSHYGLAGDELMKVGGYLNAALGIGLLAGAAVVVAIQTRKESAIVLCLALIVAGINVYALVFIPWMPVSYLACFGVGLAGNVAIVALLTVLQSMTPNAVRSRVMGFNALLTTLFSVVVYAVIWKTPNADHHVLWGILVFGALLIGTGVIGGIRQWSRGPFEEKVLNVLWRFARLFVFSYHRLEVTGKHHVPAEGSVLLCCNHTVGLDPFLLQAVNHRKIKWVMTTSYKFKCLNWFWPLIDPVFLDKDGKDIKQLRQTLNALKGGQVVGLFPEGGLQRAKRQLQPFEPGVGMIARRSGAWIVPAWIEDTPRTQGMFGHFFKPSKSKLHFGPAYRPNVDQTDEQIVTELRQNMLALMSTPGSAPGTTPGTALADSGASN